MMAETTESTERWRQIFEEHYGVVQEQANRGGNYAKASRAAVNPLNHRLPSRSAKLLRLDANPATRPNLLPKLEMVSVHACGLAPMRCSIGARSVSMAPRLSNRIMRPDLSTRSKYSFAPIGKIPRRPLSDPMGQSHSSLLLTDLSWS